MLDGLDRLRNAELLFDILPTLPNLHHLGLSDIPFESELRMKLEDMPQLTTLDLRNAHLTGGLDTFLDSRNSSYSHPTLLRTLRLDHNHNLGGTIPTILGGLLTSLNYWEMSYCNFTGPVPSQITLIRHIRMLLWNNNALDGPLPQNMSALKSMNSLNLQDNDLTGGLTLAFSPLPTQETIPRTNNNEYLIHAPQLSILKLDGNRKLGGPIPPSFGFFPRMKQLQLSDCGLTGTIPEELGNLDLLLTLHLNDNQLNGTIPVALGNGIRFNSLQLHNNAELSGDMPQSICDKVELSGNPWWITADCNTTTGGNITCPLSCCTKCY